MAKAKREKIDIDGILSSIRQKKFAPVYFFYGEEDYPIDRLIDAFLEIIVPPEMRAFNMDVLQGSETTGRALVGLALSFPMMSDYRLVVVKDLDHLKEAEALESYVAQPSPNTVLVLIGTKPDMRKKPYTALKKFAVVGESRTLYDNEIPAWIENHVACQKYKISSEAVELLQAYVGNSLRELANQIEKLIIAVGARIGIESADVESIVGISKEFSIFELTRSLGEKNPARALSIGGRMLEAGEGIPFIVVMLTRHFTMLWKLTGLRNERKSEFELAQALRVNPYHMKEYSEQLRRYPPAAIEDAFLALTDCDLAVKTSAADPRLILDTLLCTIMRARG
ncbi:MAG: DNA polymerase III subunit delta [Ignavibacteriales bacterium]|nr:DNA polymerase III subunit delta [Ignavibacteriales bacterium]